MLTTGLTWFPRGQAASLAKADEEAAEQLRKAKEQEQEQREQAELAKRAEAVRSRVCALFDVDSLL